MPARPCLRQAGAGGPACRRQAAEERLEAGVGAETSSVVGGFHCRFRLFASASSTDRWLGPRRKSASKPAMYSRFTS